MTRIVRATRGRSRWWLGVPLIAALLMTLVVVQAAFSQPSSHRKAANGTSSARAGTLPPYTCGEQVSGSVTLNADLTCASGDGLVVGANGTTINLNGHTISGDPAGNASGVLNGGGLNPGYSAVVVKNGTITGFFRGVFFGSLGGSVLVVKLVNNQQNGIASNGAGTLTGNLVYGSLSGIVAGGFDTAAKATITNNVSNGNSTYGIAVVGLGQGDVVSGNHTLGNGDTGIYSNVSGATFTGNIANANGTGMNLSSQAPGTPIKASGNKAYWNDHLGIEIGPGDTDLGKNLASGNGTAHQCENVVCS